MHVVHIESQPTHNRAGEGSKTTKWIGESWEQIANFFLVNNEWRIRTRRIRNTFNGNHYILTSIHLRQ